MRTALSAAGLGTMAIGAITIAMAAFGPAWTFPVLAALCVIATLVCYVLIWRAFR